MFRNNSPRFLPLFVHTSEGVAWGLPGGCEGVAWGLGGVNLTEPPGNPLGTPSDSPLDLKQNSECIIHKKRKIKQGFILYIPDTK
jgi:hypothetical protein